MAFSAGGAGFTSNAGTFGLYDTTPLSLSGAFNNSGTFGLGGTSSLTVAGAGGFANSGSLNLDASNGDGGGSLTIDGTLANATGGKVQVGSTFNNMDAATTLKLGGLTNASGATFQVNGSASHPPTLASDSPAPGSPATPERSGSTTPRR